MNRYGPTPISYISAEKYKHSYLSVSPELYWRIWADINVYICAYPMYYINKIHISCLYLPEKYKRI